MENQSPDTQNQNRPYRRDMLISVAMAILGVILVVLTIELSHGKHFSFLTHHRDHIVAAEIALFGGLAVEMAGRTVLQRFRQRNAIQLGTAIRAVLRIAAYLVIAVAIISLLSSNPALAAGLGSVTGVAIGFAAQNIVGNLFAGMLLAFGRLFKIGDEITVMASKGRVVEIGLIYTVVDGDDQWIFIPSSAMLTNVLQRKKESIAKTPKQENTPGQVLSSEKPLQNVVEPGPKVAEEEEKHS